MDKSFHIYKSIRHCWAKTRAFWKAFLYIFRSYLPKSLSLCTTRDVWKSLFYHTFPKMIVMIQVPKQPHCIHSFGIVLIFTILSFDIWDHGICFFHYSSNLYVSKQDFIVSSLYVLHIKIFLASSYFVAIWRASFFFFLLIVYIFIAGI